MDSLELAKAAAALPLTVLLLLVLVGGYVEWWVYGRLHRERIAEKDVQIVAANKRADLWESRFLELNSKMDALARTTANISHSVNNSATQAAGKLTSVEDKLAAVTLELAALKKESM